MGDRWAHGWTYEGKNRSDLAGLEVLRRGKGRDCNTSEDPAPSSSEVAAPPEDRCRMHLSSLEGSINPSGNMGEARWPPVFTLPAAGTSP